MSEFRKLPKQRKEPAADLHQRLDALDARIWHAARTTDDPHVAVCAARDFADQVFVALVAAAGSGRHRVNCSVPIPETPSAPSLRMERDLFMTVRSEVREVILPLDRSDAELRELVAVAHVTAANSVLIMRSSLATANESFDSPIIHGAYAIRGWRLHAGDTEPLDAAGMFAFCCSEASSGEPLPINPATRYLDAAALRVDTPPPRSWCHPIPRGS